MNRTDYCGRIDGRYLKQIVTLGGWVHRRRDHGGVIFVDLRDRDGLVQVVFDPSLALPDRRERDAILVELLSAAMPALRVLMDLPPEQLAQPPAVAEAESDLQPPALVAGADR